MDLIQAGFLVQRMAVRQFNLPGKRSASLMPLDENFLLMRGHHLNYGHAGYAPLYCGFAKRGRPGSRLQFARHYLLPLSSGDLGMKRNRPTPD